MKIAWQEFLTTSEKDLKQRIIDEKLLTLKYMNILNKLTKTDLKNILFCNYYIFDNFEGIATIITACNQRDWNKLIRYIHGTKLTPISIIHILLATLDNVNLYKDKFYYELVRFNTAYAEKFKTLLFELGSLNYIDELDLINMFKLLIRG